MPINNPAFQQLVARFITDGAFRQQVLADPNGVTAAVKNAGVDIGNATISKLTYEEHNQQGKLEIMVDNAGANWTGVAQLKLRK